MTLYNKICVTQGNNLYSTSIDYDVFQRYAASFTSKETGRYMVSPPYFEEYWKYCIY